MKLTSVLAIMTAMLGLTALAQITQPVIPPGKIAVFKAGTSDTNWPIATSRAAPCFVQVFDPVVSNSTPLVSVAMSTNASVPGSVWINAHAGSEGGGLSRSVDRSFLAIEGYVGNIIPPTSSKPSTDQGTARGIVTLDPFTNAVSVYSDLHYWFGIPIGASLTTQDNPTGIAAWDATNFWGTGNFSGTSQELDGTLYYNSTLNIDENPDDSGSPYYGHALPVEVQNYIQAAAEARIIGGTLYVATVSAAGVASGLYNFVDLNGNVVPLPQSPLTPPYNNGYDGYTFTNLFLNWGTKFVKISNFDMNPQATIAYGADQTFGIVKFTNNAGIWQQAPYYFSSTNLGTTAQSSKNQGCFGICVDFSGANPIIYATTMENGYPVVNSLAGHQNQNRLIRIVDNGVSPGTSLVAQTLAIAATTNECFGGIDFTPDLSPLISTNPVSYATTNGGSAPFSVVVASSPYAPSYQWLSNSIPISGQTASTLIFNPVNLAYNGSIIQCLVTNNYGAVTSTPAILTVTASPVTPVITSTSFNAVGYISNNVAFSSVAATGTEPFTYQWYFGGQALVDGANTTGSGYIGSQTAALTVTNIQTTDAGNYYLVVVNPAGQYASNVVDVLTVNYHTAVLTGNLPASAITFVGYPTTLSCPESGATAPVTNQWYECSLIPGTTTIASSAKLSEGGEFTGTQTPNLTIAAGTTADATNYYDVVSNGGGSVTSVVATVTVVLAPPLSSLAYSNQLYLQSFDALPDPGSQGTTAAGAVINGASVNSVNNPLDVGSINGVSYSLANPFDFAYPVVNNNYIGGLGLTNLSGWYGSAATNDPTSGAYWPGVDGITRFGAQDGDQSTGGVIDFGPNDVEFGLTGTNRALGLLSTGTTGPTTVALKLVNNSGGPLNYMNLSFLGELWRNGTGPRTLRFGYTVDPTGNSFILTSQSISNATTVPSLNFSFPTASVVTVVDGTQSSNQVSLAVTNLLVSGGWPANGALWLIWSLDYNGAGSGNGYAIDNLAVSATPALVASTAPSVSESGASNISITNATLNFSVNPNNGATVYAIYYGTNSNPASTAGAISGATGSLVAGTSAVNLTSLLAGLSPGTVYHYQIVAQNFTGISVTPDDAFITPAGVSVVSTAGASAIGTTSAMLNGTNNPAGLANTYWFNYGLTTSYGSSTVPTVLAAGVSPASVSNLVTGLTAGTVYHYQIVASNFVATVVGADASFTTLSAAPVVTTVAAANIFATAAKLNASVNPSYGATTYWFVYGTNNSTAFTNLTAPASLGTSNVAATVASVISGLLPSTTYYFEIVATNLAGTSTGSILSFTTGTVSGAPTVATVAASSITASSAKLNATVNPNNDAATYWFIYGTNTTTAFTNQTSATILSATNSAASVNSSISGLVTNALYYFEIVAVNSSGASTNGPASFTTLSVTVPSVLTLAASNIFSTVATLNASVNPSNGPTTCWFVYGTNTSTTYFTNLTVPTTLAASGNASIVTSPVGGLLQGVPYYFQAVATNITGTITGGASNFTTTAVSGVPIVAATAASSIAASTAKMNATVNPTNYVSTYWFIYGTNATTALTNLTAPATLAATNVAVAVSSSLSGLLPGTTNYYQIVATNLSGLSMSGVTNFATLVPVPTVVPLVVQSSSASSATLGALVNPNNAVTGYWFKYGIDTTTSLTNLTATNYLAAGYSSVVSTKSISGLLPGTTYYFQVSATNAGGKSTSWNATFTTQPLVPTVTTLAASNVTAIAATLDAAINPNNGATTYWFNYGTTTGYGTTTTPGALVASMSSVTTNFTVVGLQPGTVYHFQIVATNSAGVALGADSSLTTLQFGANLNGGLFKYIFTNATGGSYSILSTNDLTVPRSSWPKIGSAVESPSGSCQYIMTNQITPTNADSFFIWKTNSP